MILLIKFLIVSLLTFLLCLPFLPFKKVGLCFACYDFDKRERHKNLPFVISALLVALALLLTLPYINRLFDWLVSLSFFQWLLDLLPKKLQYTGIVFKYIILNVATAYLFLVIKSIIKARLDRIYSTGKHSISSKSKKNDKGTDKDRARVSNKEERERKLAKIKKDSELVFEPEPEERQQDDNGQQQDRENRISKLKDPKSQHSNARKSANKKKELEFETFRDFFKFVYNKFKGLFYDSEDEFETERYPAVRWGIELGIFLFIIGILFLVLAFGIIFPVFFDLKVDFIYLWSSKIISNIYLYPMIGIVVLREIHVFLSGIPKADKEYEGLGFAYSLNKRKRKSLDLGKLKASLLEKNTDYNVTTLHINTKDNGTYDLTNAPHAIKKLDEIIKKSNQVSNKDYLFGFEMMLKGKNVLFDTSLYSSLGLYLLYYLNTVLLLGHRVLIICSDNAELSRARDYIQDGLERITRSAMPTWRIVNFDGLRTGKTADILLVTPEEISDKKLFVSGRLFFDELTDAFVLNTEKILMVNNYQCLVLAKRLEGEVGKRGKDRILRYTFLTEGNTFNLDHSIQQLFNLGDRGLVSVSTFGTKTSADVFVWTPGQNTAVRIDRAANQTSLERCIAEISSGFGIKKIGIVSENADRWESKESLRGVEFNKCDVSQNDLAYIIVEDGKFNLASALYHYLRYSGRKETVLHIIDKPYLLRQYFLANISRYANHYEILGKVSYEHAKDNVSKLVALLSEAVSEAGIPRDEFIKRAAEMHEFIDAPEKIEQGKELDVYVTACLKKALGNEYQGDVLKYRIEYTNVPNKGFDYYLHITDNKKLFTGFMEENSPIKLDFSNSEPERSMPIPRKMLCQHFIESQIISFDNKYYTIKKIDLSSGVMTLDNTDVNINFPDDYIQTRKYTINRLESKRTANVNYITDTASVKNVAIELYDASVAVDTTGYFEVSGTLKMVNFADPGNKYHELSEAKRAAIARSVETNVLRVSMQTDKECKENVAVLFTIILQEMMKTFFPEVYKCISVCPVTSAEYRRSDSFSKQFRNVLKLYPELVGDGLPTDQDQTEGKLEFVIIEDVAGGNGINGNFIEAQGKALLNLIGFAADFLSWAAEDPQNRLEYLRFGYEDLPKEFNINELCELLKQFNNKIEYADYQFDEEALRCSICHCEADEDELVYVNGERCVCKNCRKTTVNSYELLEDCLRRTRDALVKSTSVADTLPDVQIDFVSTKELKDRQKEINKAIENKEKTTIGYCDYLTGEIFVEYGLSECAVCGLIARLFTSIWQDKNGVFDGSDICFGQLDYEEIHVADALAFSNYLNALREAYDSNSGYRELCEKLKEAGTSDSFAFLLGASNEISKRQKRGRGVGYTIRARDPLNVPMLHYNLLTDAEKAIYDLILAGIKEFREEISGLEGIESSEQLDKIMTALTQDHSEIFWLEHQSYRYMQDLNNNINTVIPNYCMDRDQAEKRQKKIDREADKILSGISASTGDYEAALLIHESIVKIIDYDSIMLEEQKKLDKKRLKYIDDLRSIYGTLVQHRAVCAGYARAYAYLLNKIGIECAYVRGDCHDGGAHAWNLLNLEGKYYYTDVTWDDHSNTDPKKHYDYSSFAYFCITTEELLRTRDIDYLDRFNYPDCTAVECNYYVRENYFFDVLNHSEIKDAIVDQYKKGIRAIGLKFANETLYERARKYLLAEGGLSDVFSGTGVKTSKMLCYGDSNLYVVIIRVK